MLSKTNMGQENFVIIPLNFQGDFLNKRKWEKGTQEFPFPREGKDVRCPNFLARCPGAKH